MNISMSDSELLERCKTFRAAIRLCWEVSGFGMKRVAGEIEMEEKNLSRCLSLNDEDRRYLPDDRLIPFMVACGNSLPLRWLSLKLGQPSVEGLQLDIVSERLQRETERQVYFETIGKIQRLAIYSRCEQVAKIRSRFSLAAGVPGWLADGVPVWLADDVWLLSQSLLVAGGSYGSVWAQGA